MQLVLRALAKSYDDREVFADVSATFGHHRVSAVVGPSGSGKSTLLAIIAGLVRSDAGEVVAVGVDAADASGAGGPVPAGAIAWVSQAPRALRGRTVLDNVLIGPLANGRQHPAAREAALAALADTGLAAFGPRPAGTLSGGELQRMCLARAIASGRELILADEPTAGLDRANAVHLAEVLRGLRSRCTIVVATHDEALVAAAEEVLRLG